MTTPTWVDLPGLFPLHGEPTEPTKALRTQADDDGVSLQQRHQADVLLLSVMIIFLVGSYLVCRYCRCRWLYSSNGRQKIPGSRSYAYTMHQTSASAAPTSSVVAATSKKFMKKKTVLVSEMEEPFLGPPEYQQPPPYELSPPAYDYLPSAPPLSDDSNQSPRQV